MWMQRTITLRPRPRGFHLITDEVVRQTPELSQVRVGLMHLFLQHTSASLALGENADPTVRADMSAHFSQHLAPANMPYYRHIYEGPDDMPAHIKSALLGVSLTIPVSNGRLRLGVWQGIYLGEHRDRAQGRRLVITLHGD